jgi:hypothetical protein
VYTPWVVYKLKADIPILEGIMAKTWGKEDELKQLKSELATLDRKIAAELAPKQENSNDSEEVKRDDTPQTSQAVDVPTRSTDEKKSMEAEPIHKYSEREPLSSRITIGGCGVTPPRRLLRSRKKILALVSDIETLREYFSWR